MPPGGALGGWTSLAGYTLGAGIVALAGFLVMGVLVIPEGALHEWAGLAQRVLILGGPVPLPGGPVTATAAADGQDMVGDCGPSRAAEFV